MDVDPLQAVQDAAEPEDTPTRDAERRRSRLNSYVAIAVALLATFMGICKVKDDNIGQAMQQAQADKIDDWAFYQARNIREEVAKAAIAQLTLQEATAPLAAHAAYDRAIATYVALEKDQEEKKATVRAQAEAAQKRYDSLNYRDDQFDLSDALLAISIAMLALTSLTQKRWLFALAMIPTFFGVLMGLSGLFGWHIHSDSVSALLS